MFSESLNKNEALIKSKIGESYDTNYRRFKVAPFNDAEAFLVYISGMADSEVVEETLLQPLMRYSGPPVWRPEFKKAECISKLSEKKPPRRSEYISILKEHSVFTTGARVADNWDQVCDSVIEGDTALFIDRCPSALILKTRKYEGRAIDEPQVESEVRGPRDGFVENIKTNTALIRRRIKDYGLRFDTFKLGERTKTTVLIAYIDSLADHNLVKEVKQRLSRIKVDGILASEPIEEMIEDAPFSLFPKIAHTERPDKVCAALLEGRVAILVDNTPFVLTVPAVFWQFFHSSGDYYERIIPATFIRCIRYLALFLSISTSSIYVLLTSFHQEMLPTTLALKIAAGRSSVPFPAVIEAFLMEITLEIIREAGLRMPRALGQIVGIVGALVIGQAAVSAGLVSPLLLIAVAVAAISTFAIPSYSMGNAVRIIRFPVLFITSFFGLMGYLTCLATLLLHLISLRSFGAPYLAPVIPYDNTGIKDVLVRAPWWKMAHRPGFVRAKDRSRQTRIEGSKPTKKK